MNAREMLARLPWPAAMVGAWDGASVRERRLVLCAGVIVLVALFWAFAWQGIVADSARAERDLVRDRAVLSRARAQADEITGLQHASETARTGDARTAVERVLNDRGLKPMLTSLDVQERRVRLTFAAIRFDALIGTLDALAKSDGLRPIELTLTPRVEPGSLRAEITLGR
jgi:type II secretory pathway component PulM